MNLILQFSYQMWSCLPKYSRLVNFTCLTFGVFVYVLILKFDGWVWFSSSGIRLLLLGDSASVPFTIVQFVMAYNMKRSHYFIVLCLDWKTVLYFMVFLSCFYRFSSVTERFFMELNTRRIDTSAARSETLSIINGMRYLKLGVCVTIKCFM